MLAATALAQTERDASPSPTMISPTAPNGTTTRISVEPPANPPVELLAAAGQGEDDGCHGTSKRLHCGPRDVGNSYRSSTCL